MNLANPNQTQTNRVITAGILAAQRCKQKKHHDRATQDLAARIAGTLVRSGLTLASAIEQAALMAIQTKTQGQVVYLPTRNKGLSDRRVNP